MNRSYYSDKSVDNFIKKTLCQGDETLYRYFENEDVTKFRRRLQILNVNQKTLEQAIYSYITDSMRDIILETVASITSYMEPMGDLVITGGEAFNNYFDREDRIVTSDIDTKFVPIFKLPDGKVLATRSKKFFEYLQVSKLLLWDYLGKVSRALGPIIAERVNSLKGTRLSRVLGISLASGGPPYVTRRYTLIKKSKQSNNSSVTEGNVLIDVELFALDLRLRYYSLDDNKIRDRNLGGILDIAIMRPGEIGYEVAYSKERGIMYKNPVNNKIKYNPNILVAGKRFLLEDLYLMQTLGLRPKKKEKDRKRMVTFSKKVLGMDDITSKNSIEEIFKKSFKKIQNTSEKINSKNRKVFNPKTFISRASKVNPMKYGKWTTEPNMNKLVSYYFVGLKGRPGLQVPTLKETSGKYRFDMKTKKWVLNDDPLYIKNEYNYRPSKSHAKNYKTDFTKLNAKNVLYGYNPRRNKNMSNDIIKKASQIPIIGLKNTGAK